MDSVINHVKLPKQCEITINVQLTNQSCDHEFDDKRRQITHLARRRTGHCNLNQYLHRFQHTESPLCECGDGNIENMEHYLIQCRKYDEQREKLRRNVRFAGMRMEKLLGYPQNITHNGVC